MAHLVCRKDQLCGVSSTIGLIMYVHNLLPRASQPQFQQKLVGCGRVLQRACLSVCAGLVESVLDCLIFSGGLLLSNLRFNSISAAMMDNNMYTEGVCGPTGDKSVYECKRWIGN